MYEDLHLIRKRYIPDEAIELKGDTILSVSDDLILTCWHVIHPRKDIDSGISAYYLKKGYKISKIFDKNHDLVYWYTDIIKTDYDENTKTYTFTDLMIDVLIYPDGLIKVVDLDEYADILSKHIVPEDVMITALKTTDRLLKNIYSGNFQSLVRCINEAEKDLQRNII
jgi:predicted RNA-binding protein associated with RNAse of E/G family